MLEVCRHDLGGLVRANLAMALNAAFRSPFAQSEGFLNRRQMPRLIAIPHLANLTFWHWTLSLASCPSDSAGRSPAACSGTRRVLVAAEMADGFDETLRLRAIIFILRALLLCHAMPPVGYVAYIDEAGDDGLAQCDQTTREDSSERMVMAAVVVRVDNDQQIIGWLVLAIFIGCLLTGIASFASSARVGMAGTCPAMTGFIICLLAKSHPCQSGQYFVSEQRQFIQVVYERQRDAFRTGGGKLR